MSPVKKTLDSRAALVQAVKQNLIGALDRNKAQAAKRRNELLAQLKDNLGKGQTKEMNQWLIDKYVSVKATGLNQMQQAFEKVVQ